MNPKINRQTHVRVKAGPGRKAHECSICNKRFIRMDLHMMTHMRKGPHRCSQCSKTFSLKTNLAIHMMTHTVEKAYKCSRCPKSFTVRSTLNRHMMSHTGEKPYKCAQCPKAFSLKANVVIHMSTHTGERTFKCSQCDKAFRVYSSLNRHILTHHPRKQPRKYTVSNKRNGRLETPKPHTTAPSGGRPYQCSHCERAFRWKSALINHLTTHNTKATRHSVSSKKFDRAEPLKPPRATPILKTKQNSKMKPQRQDVPTTNGEQAHRCIYCGRKFPEEQELVKHVKQSHKGAKRFRCYICGMELKRSENLQRHVMIHTGERPHQCPQCDKAFCLRKELNAHMRKHPMERPHQCHMCDMAFVEEPSLQRHMLVHKGLKPYKCTVGMCKERFRTRKAVKEHMLIHTVKKRHQCSICTKRFTHRQTLEHHMRIHSGKRSFTFVDRPRRATRDVIYDEEMMTEQTMNQETMTHKHDKPYKCSRCSKRFAQLEALEEHMIDHEVHIQDSLNLEGLVEEESYEDKLIHKCWHCDTGFIDQHDLFKHITAHICFICHDIFCQSEYLDEHIKTHAAANSTECLRCGENFSNKYELLKHMKTHNDKKSVEYVLKIKKTPTGKNSYRCSGCDSVFDDILTACSHILSHIGKDASRTRHSLNSTEDDHTIQRTVFELDKDVDIKEDILSQIYESYSDCLTCVKGALTATELENHLVAHRYMVDLALCLGYK